MASSRSPPISVLLVLALCLISSLDMASSTGADFAYMSLAWPGGYCDLVTSCCTPSTGEPAADFLVIALETYSSATGNAVTYCNETACKFLVNPLNPVIGDMFLYWPSINCPSSNGKDKWTDGWCTYGYCSGLIQLDYFNRTLVLRQQANVLGALQDAGIKPSSSKTYKLNNIQNALSNKLGASRTVVECVEKSKSFPWFGYDYYLSRIRVCVSMDVKSIIDCPVKKQSTCGNDVWFLPHPFAKGVGEELGDAAVNPIELPSGGDAAV